MLGFTRSLLIVLISLSLLGCNKGEKPKASATANSASQAQSSDVLTVSYCQGFRHSVDRTLKLVGTVVVDKSVKVPSLATGQVDEVFVVQGQRVGKGQTLATIDTSDSRLAVKRSQAQLAQELAVLGLKSPTEKLRGIDEVPAVIKAKASLENARQNLERYKSLHKQHLVSDQEYLQQETTFISAKADYQAAKESVFQNLASVQAAQFQVAISQKAVTDAVITAPVSGVIEQVTTASGAYLSAGGDSGIIILKDRPLFVSLDIAQIHLSQLAVGRTLTFKTLPYPDREVMARVTQLGGRVDPNSGGIPVRAQVLNPPNWLVPGLSAQVELFTERLPDQMLVPQAAVLTQAGKSVVYAVKSSSGELATVEKLPVTTGQIIGDWVVVDGSIDEAASFIASDLLSLEDNGKVKLGQKLKIAVPESLR